MIICLVHKLPKHCHKLRGRAGKYLKSRYTWYAIKGLVLRGGDADINWIELSNQKTQPKFFFSWIFLLILSKSWLAAKEEQNLPL